MKKSLKALTLQRETLLLLNEQAIRVAGGTSNGNNCVTVGCPTITCNSGCYTYCATQGCPPGGGNSVDRSRCVCAM